MKDINLLPEKYVKINNGYVRTRVFSMVFIVAAAIVFGGFVSVIAWYGVLNSTNESYKATINKYAYIDKMVAEEQNQNKEIGLRQNFLNMINPKISKEKYIELLAGCVPENSGLVLKSYTADDSKIILSIDINTYINLGKYVENIRNSGAFSDVKLQSIDGVTDYSASATIACTP